MFGLPADKFIKMIDQLELKDISVDYKYTDNEDFCDLLIRDLSKGMEVYWKEMHGRVHLTSVTSILRSFKWISGIQSAVKENNLLVFAASLRGLIESAADTQTAINNIPVTFERDHLFVNQAVLGESNEVFIIEEIEDTLVHYSYGRKLKKGETAPHAHKAKQVRDYIKILEKAQVQHVVECYSFLCDLTHPGASSVWMWIEPAGELQLNLRTNQDSKIISGFLSEYNSMFTDLLFFAFNGPLISLALLNYFELPKYHTSALLKWDFSNIPLWQKIQPYLKGVIVKAK